MRSACLVIGAVLAVIGALVQPGALAQQSQCDGNFHIVHDVPDGALNAVDFASGGSGWAVGFDYENDEDRVSALSHGPDERPWIVRFDDDSFEDIHPVHQPGTELAGVSALSDADVWAVGEYSATYKRSKAIAYHWDGTTWTRMTVSRRGKRAQLNDVVAISPTDVWAVGFYVRSRDRGVETLVAHYDGSTWSHVPAPSPRRLAVFDAVDGVSANNAWAVGSFSKRYSSRVLAARWTGSEWKRRRLGLDFLRNETLHGVDVVTPRDIWMAGDGNERPLILHREGRNWTFTDFPEARRRDGLEDIAASPNAAWTVGDRFILRPYETVVPVAAHFTGDVWQPSSFEGDPYGHVSSVALDDAGKAWAVGETFDPESDPGPGEVIERACA